MKQLILIGPVYFIALRVGYACSLYKIRLSRHRILQFQSIPNTWKFWWYDKIKQTLWGPDKICRQAAWSIAPERQVLVSNPYISLPG
jgi:hypothetical protein